jgi:long-subunit fatty acid transport protein
MAATNELVALRGVSQVGPARRIRAGAVLWILMAAGAALAQETPATFEFSFSNPGARSLGLGGAFAGLADDATAAFANPAGLVQLLRPEISIEGRHWSYSTPYVAGGRYQGEPTGIGLDTVDGMRTERSLEDLNGISYASFVYPTGRFSLAIYTHQLAKFRSRTETQGIFQLPNDVFEVRSFDRRWSSDLDLAGYGLAAGYRINERLSLGLGVVYFQASLDALFNWYLPDDNSIESLFALNSYLPERQFANGDMSIEDSDWGVTAGVLWNPSRQWSVGGFYRQGPDVDTLYTARAGQAVGEVDPSFEPGEDVLIVASGMKFPDVYGLGVAYRSADGRLALGLEWDRVEYSTIFGRARPVQVGGSDTDANLDITLAADDGNELRVGAEYAFLDMRPVIAVRLGAWLDPDHRFHSISSDPEHQALYPPGEDELHLAVGFGLAFERFQLDAGVDFSDLVDTASLSLIYSF